MIYLISTSHDDRDLHAGQVEFGNPPKPSGQGFCAGIQIDPDRNRLLVAGGDASTLLAFDIQSDGTLGEQTEIILEGYVDYIRFDPIQNTLWYTRWDEPFLQVFDLTTNRIIHTIELTAFGWQMHQESRTLMVSSMIEKSLVTFDMDTYAQLESIEMPGGVSSMCKLQEDLYLALSDVDMIARLRVDTPSELEMVPVAPDFKDSQGLPYANSNVNGLACDTLGGRVYASRGADNLIAVFDAPSLNQLVYSDGRLSQRSCAG